MGANTKMYKIKPKIAKGMLAFGPKKNVQKFFTKNKQTTKYKILINVFMILVLVFFPLSFSETYFSNSVVTKVFIYAVNDFV